jgi:hypothetical protein
LYSPAAATPDMITSSGGELAPGHLHRIGYQAVLARAARARRRPAKIRLETVEATIDRIRRDNTRFPYIPMI